MRVSVSAGEIRLIQKGLALLDTYLAYQELEKRGEEYDPIEYVNAMGLAIGEQFVQGRSLGTLRASIDYLQQALRDQVNKT